MTFQEYALAVLAPKVNPREIVTAALKHKLCVIDREIFDFEKDYSVYIPQTDDETDNKGVRLMFIFNEEESLIADNKEHLAAAIERIKSVG